MIEIGQIKFEKKKLERQFRHELKDDWFPDPVKFKDYFNSGKIGELIQHNFDINHGEYIPTKRDVANLPKPDFTIRSALETGILDRVLYHGLCSHLCESFDKKIPWFVFSHRESEKKDKSRYMFRRGIPSWIDFLGAVKAIIEPGKYLLTTDLTNYFDNIDINKLKTNMNAMVTGLDDSAKKKNETRGYIDFLFECLKYWTYEDHRGLPQNRDGSSFLANIYMRPVDLFMREKGFRFFRYMDDIKIVCDSEIEARRALQLLVVELRKLGLAVNSKKTKIVEVVDRKSIEKWIEEPSSELRYLQELWESRKISLIKHSFGPLRKLALKCLKNDDLVSRDFRFAINRLVLLAGCEEVAVPDSYFAEITDLIISSLSKCPSPTDQYVSYLERVPLGDPQIDEIVNFVIESDYNIYEWQCYRMWNLLGIRRIERKELIEAAVSSLGDEDNAARAGATLYLGAFGDLKDRQLIAKNFSSLSSFFGQRAAILAVQELGYTKGIEEHITGNVRSDLMGVYRNANKMKIGHFTKPEPVSLTQIVDADRDYA